MVEAVAVDLKPSIGRTRRLMRRWSCSLRLFKYAPADPDRLQPALGEILQAICGVAGNDRLVVGLAPVDDDAIRSAMTLQRLSEEALGRRRSRCSLNQNVSPTLSAYSDEAERLLQREARRPFRSIAGHDSDLKPDSCCASWSLGFLT